MFTIPTRTEYRLNTRSLAISVYRAIRMGWTPDVVYGQDWPESDYKPLVDTLPASMTDHDFNTFAHRYAKTAGAIYRLSRDAATTEQWFRMYRKLTNQEEPTMNELTDEQIMQQDAVDNLVFEMINAARQAQGLAPIEWDIEIIAAAREPLIDYICILKQFMTEMEFYPYLED